MTIVKAVMLARRLGWTAFLFTLHDCFLWVPVTQVSLILIHKETESYTVIAYTDLLKMNEQALLDHLTTVLAANKTPA
jgi:hypothetical protein